MGILFGLFPQIHLDLNFDSIKLLFMCNKLVRNMILKNILSMRSNHIKVFALLGDPTKIFYSVQ